MFKLNRHLTFALLICLSPSVSEAQNNALGSWNILQLKFKWGESWSGFTEAQLRSLRFYDHFHYHEFKGGMTYKANAYLKLTLAGGSYQTYREGGTFVLPKNNNELRIWPQIVVSNTMGKFKVEHRYRTELRFTSNGYRNRFRYRAGVFYTFGKDTKGYKPYQISASNEIFFTNREPYFERNRLQIALTYKLNPVSSVQIGYSNQFDYQINDEIGRDFLMVGYYLDINFKERSKENSDELKDN